MTEKKVKNGLFIVVDGPDGCGKTTAAEMLSSALEAQGYKVVNTRQPGGTPLSEKLRDLLLHKDNDPYNEFTQTSEYLVFSAAREILDANLIKPSMDKGEIVISDRHTLSSYAYQGRRWEAVDDMVGRVPHLTVFLDAPLEVTRQRCIERGDLDRMESKSIDFFKVVRDRYLEGINHPSNGFVCRIDATDFESEAYQKDVDMAITTASKMAEGQVQFSLEFAAPDAGTKKVSVKQFEESVRNVEDVRVICRCECSSKVPEYDHERLADDATYGDLVKRLDVLLKGIPYVIASLERSPTSETPIKNIRTVTTAVN